MQAGAPREQSALGHAALLEACREGGWLLTYKKSGKQLGSETAKLWAEAVGTGKQLKLMVKCRNESVWYRSKVVALGHTADSVRIGRSDKTRKKRKRNAEHLIDVQKTKPRVEKTQKVVRLHPVMALARAAKSCDPATCAFLQYLCAPGPSSILTWTNVKRILSQRKDVLEKQLAIVNSQLDQAELEIASRKDENKQHLGE